MNNIIVTTVYTHKQFTATVVYIYIELMIHSTVEPLYKNTPELKTPL